MANTNQRAIEGPITERDFVMERLLQQNRQQDQRNVRQGDVVSRPSFAESGHSPQIDRMNEHWGKREINGSRFPDTEEFVNPFDAPAQSALVPPSMERGVAPVGFRENTLSREEAENMFYQAAYNHGLPGVDGTPTNSQISSAFAEQNKFYDDIIINAQENDVKRKMITEFEAQG